MGNLQWTSKYLFWSKWYRGWQKEEGDFTYVDGQYSIYNTAKFNRAENANRDRLETVTQAHGGALLS